MDLMERLIKQGDAFLQHHGIKGQKWGVRNGPPYPLDSNVSTGKRLKKNKQIIPQKGSGINHQSKINIKNVDILTEATLSSHKRYESSARIGLKAYNKLNDDDKDENDEYVRDWFVEEDQTIGLFTISDLVNQGYSKGQIKDLIKQAVKIHEEDYYDATPGVFQLDYANSYYNDKYINDYISLCIKFKNKEGKK